MTFNPNEHLLKLKNKDYLEVKWRLVWFRAEHPHGTIETKVVQFDLEKQFALFAATVADGEGGSATGHGSETAKDFPDFIEKAESKAIGRALAALGYGTQFAPELEEGERVVDAPVENERNGHAPQGQKRAGEEEERALAVQSDALKAMLAKAKQRAFALGMKKRHEWDVFRHELTGKESDDALILADMAKINGELTKREQQQPAQAS